MIPRPAVLLAFALASCAEATKVEPGSKFERSVKNDIGSDIAEDATVGAGNGIKALFTPREKPGTMERFERSRSVKKTERAMSDLLKRGEEKGYDAAPAAAAVLAELDPAADGAREFVIRTLKDTHPPIQSAAAHKLREIDLAAAPK